MKAEELATRLKLLVEKHGDLKVTGHLTDCEVQRIHVLDKEGRSVVGFGTPPHEFFLE